MAANLRAPGQFGRNKFVQTLLPPSSFESTTDLSKATVEIMKLKKENLTLREDQVAASCSKHIASAVASQPLPARCTHEGLAYHHHLDDIISRQLAEITGLHSELAKCEACRQRDTADLHNRLEQCGAEGSQKVAALEAELQSMAATHNQQRELWAKQVNQLKSERLEELHHINEQLQNAKLQHEQQLAEVHSRFSAELADSTETHSKMQDALRRCKAELAERSNDVRQLKKYIGESEEISKSTEIWRKEVSVMRTNLQVSECERVELLSSVELLNVQLSSLRQMFTLQEHQLSQHNEDLTGKKKPVLLTRWREKVFELMVKLTTADLVQKVENSKWVLKLQTSDAALQTCRCECSILQHSMSDTKAQLELSQTLSKNLQEQLWQAQEMALSLDDKCQSQQQLVFTTTQFTQCLYEKWGECDASLQTALSRLKAFQQRITFASGRVQMLQGQFARKEAILRLERSDQRTQSEPTCQSSQHDSEEERELREEERELREELSRVTGERDVLSAQMKTDALRLDQLVTSARAQIADEMAGLRRRGDELEHNLMQTTARNDALTERLEAAEVEASEASETVEKLKTDLAKAHLQAQKDLVLAQRASDAQHTHQVVKWDQQVSDARRQHAKAVVCVRQMERQNSRARERAAEQTQRLEADYRRQVAALVQKLKTAEADRNLLMTTLRQEGLVSKYKGQRPLPAPLVDETVSHKDVVDEQGDRLASKSALQDSDDDTIDDIVADLKDLTTAVMADVSTEH